tara:strand:+ start:1245 stop:1580 length:336 start_codon:yes stop_codon:yes gene_type:complete
MNKKDTDLLAEAYSKIYKQPVNEEVDPYSQEAVESRFNQRLELAKAAGVQFLKYLFAIGEDTWDKALPEGFSENLVNDIVSNSIGENMMARDIKAHFVRVIDDVAPAQDSM